MKCKDCKEEGCPFRCYTENGECSYVDYNEDSFDWQSFRAEAAKDILCSVILAAEAEESFDKSLDNAINNSIKAVDKLISKLKEKEDK